MAPKLTAANQNKIPAITWSSNLVWKLINLAQKDENKNVMIGKSKDDNTTADNKTKVYKRIAEQVIPHIFALDAETAGKHTGTKWESLKKVYRTHAARLYKTSEGVGNKDTEQSTHHEYADCYVPADGPDDTTTQTAKNIWDEIKEDFVFFPELHRLLSSRPNITPIAVTTGVGPEGRRTVHYQGPTEQARVQDELIDPALLRESEAMRAATRTPLGPARMPNVPAMTQAAPSAAAVTVEKENTAVSTPNRRPKASTFGSVKLDDAVEKAKNNIKQVPSKRTSAIEDEFTKMSRKTFHLARMRFKEEQEYKRRKLDLEERELLLKEQAAGLISSSQWKKRRNAMEKVPVFELSSSPAPSREGSPDWDEEEMDKDMNAADSDDIDIDGE